jgi:quercetin dioxygenase-like cupin family protein
MRRTAVLGFVASLTSAATLMPTHAWAQDTSSSWVGLPTGATLTVTQGNPQTGPSTMRMTMPAGYVVAMHRHPTDESVTVISGTYIVTYGAVATTLTAGQSTTIKGGDLHSERTEGPTVIEVRSVGPYGIVYTKGGKPPKAVTP